MTLSVLGCFWHFYSQEKQEYASFAEDFSTLEKHSIALIKRMPSSDFKRVVASVKNKKKVKKKIIKTVTIGEEERLENYLRDLRNSSELGDDDFKKILNKIGGLHFSKQKMFEIFSELVRSFDDERNELKAELYKYLLELANKIEVDGEQLKSDLLFEEEVEELRQLILNHFEQETENVTPTVSPDLTVGE